MTHPEERERERWEAAIKDPKWVADRDALTQPSPQPAEDLAAIVEEIDTMQNLSREAFEDRLKQHWPAIRAALARERELREFVNAVSDRKTSQESEDYAGHSPGCQAIRGADDGDGRFDVWCGDPADCTCGWTKVLAALESVEALLAQPAAGEERERG